MFYLNKYAFICGTILTEKVKISVDIRQRTSLMKLAAIDIIIRKKILDETDRPLIKFT